MVLIFVQKSGHLTLEVTITIKANGVVFTLACGQITGVEQEISIFNFKFLGSHTRVKNQCTNLRRQDKDIYKKIKSYSCF